MPSGVPFPQYGQAMKFEVKLWSQSYGVLKSEVTEGAGRTGEISG